MSYLCLIFHGVLVKLERLVACSVTCGAYVPLDPNYMINRYLFFLNLNHYDNLAIHRCV